jgi:putative modified peptide
MSNNFSAEVADQLLEKLSGDDDFRALFEKNPRAALRKLGHDTPEAERDSKGVDPVMCVSCVKTLASKEQIQAARKELQTQLTSQVFSFDMAALEAS